ncbi:MAG: nitronate monooxygenase [Planctomycetaceae bacterium]|nr:nitronate monooxygenase [Planctomycetaceae bacterium]
MRIGDLTIDPPIVQGGMGVRVSRANLASAVANEGCAGMIASVGLGDYEHAPGADFVELNRIALRDEIRKARRQSSGVIGVNAMVAASNYESLVGVCAQEKVDMIISGAGLPMHLPAYTAGTNIMLVPVVSSARSLRLIYRKWMKDFNRGPDAVVVEGIHAGGHLGYSLEQIQQNSPTLDQTLAEVLQFISELPAPFPVIAAGGIFSGADMARYLAAGASGVQIATRFVCTDECDVDIRFKQAYLDARPGDLTIIKSPVGMPGRVIRNAFVDRINSGHRVPFKCKYQCLRTCSPAVAPYCIAEVLARASQGQLDESFVFAGSNAWRCDEIIPVKRLIQKIMQEYNDALLSPALEMLH